MAKNELKTAIQKQRQLDGDECQGYREHEGRDRKEGIAFDTGSHAIQVPTPQSRFDGRQRLRPTQASVARPLQLNEYIEYELITEP